MQRETFVGLLAPLLFGCGGLAQQSQVGADADVGTDATVDASTDDASDDGAFFDVVRDACADCNIARGFTGGCCQAGTCVPAGEQTANVCGSNGLLCAACAPNEQCFKGTCLAQVTNCGPANCAGCCLSPTACLSGIADNACGFGGSFCQNCFGGGGVCNQRVAGGGSCSQPCGPKTCYGCCQNGVCLSGRADTSACGTAGQVCATCGAGQSCIDQGGPGIGGACESPPFCSPSNCPSCCKGNQCVNGDADDACGEQSEMCQDCTAQGAVCMNHQCVGGCTAASCKGCCKGSLCAAGNQDFACGKNGDPCSDCTPSHGRCLGQACGN